MPDWLIPVLAIAAFAVAFPAFWCGVVWVIAQTGWARLAARFPADAAPDGPDARTFRFTSGRIGLANYNGVLTVGVRPDGLRLSVMVLFRPGHAPLFVPWGEITDVQERRVLWTRQVRLRVGRPHVTTVTLPAAVLDAMRAAAPSAG